jgi:DNA invertase Pin-like site-specific DNA recombinase
MGRSYVSGRQALTDAGCAEVLNDNVSGVGGPIDGRPGLTRCRTRLMLGDEMVAPSPELLARSAADVTALANDLDARGVSLVVLNTA